MMPRPVRSAPLNTALCSARHYFYTCGFIVKLHSKRCTLKTFLNIMIISVFVKLKMKNMARRRHFSCYTQIIPPKRRDYPFFSISCSERSARLQELVFTVHPFVSGILFGIFCCQFFGAFKIAQVFNSCDPVKHYAALKSGPVL